MIFVRTKRFLELEKRVSDLEKLVNDLKNDSRKENGEFSASPSVVALSGSHQEKCAPKFNFSEHNELETFDLLEKTLKRDIQIWVNELFQNQSIVDSLALEVAKTVVFRSKPKSKAVLKKLSNIGVYSLKDSGSTDQLVSTLLELLSQANHSCNTQLTVVARSDLKYLIGYIIEHVEPSKSIDGAADSDLINWLEIDGNSDFSCLRGFDPLVAAEIWLTICDIKSGSKNIDSCWIDAAHHVLKGKMPTNPNSIKLIKANGMMASSDFKNSMRIGGFAMSPFCFEGAFPYRKIVSSDWLNLIALVVGAEPGKNR
ncbi:hypothetical protein K0504_04545 [Neiella marina]|uniref:Uncharacterized protein n=1 Tax=Neiella holothuriorum TaxID=2870530 RepID=A0ABS7EED9_9GAMM|nr:hypothetical protein [Neiella holothuriorum]MBW8190298.1 hypothetical protein [Neiella holothuriorum]